MELLGFIVFLLIVMSLFKGSGRTSESENTKEGKEMNERRRQEITATVTIFASIPVIVLMLAWAAEFFTNSFGIDRREPTGFLIYVYIASFPFIFFAIILFARWLSSKEQEGK